MISSTAILLDTLYQARCAFALSGINQIVKNIVMNPQTSTETVRLREN